jgi:hypothetical protein
MISSIRNSGGGEGRHLREGGHGRLDELHRKRRARAFAEAHFQIEQRTITEYAK